MVLYFLERDELVVTRTGVEDCDDDKDKDKDEDGRITLLPSSRWFITTEVVAIVAGTSAELGIVLLAVVIFDLPVAVEEAAEEEEWKIFRKSTNDERLLEDDCSSLRMNKSNFRLMRLPQVNTKHNCTD